MPTNEELERKLEIKEKNYAELMRTVATMHRVNDALSADLADAIGNMHWAETERDTIRSRFNDAKTENERLRIELEKAESAKLPEGVTAEDVENLIAIARNEFYRRYVFGSLAVLGDSIDENAAFDAYVDDYVYPASNLESIGITREWFIEFFHEELRADYEAEKKRLAGEEGEDD